jgi:phytoene/squalene synthetase
MVDRRSRPALRALIGIYSGLLSRIEKRSFEVLAERISLTAMEKCWIVLRARVSR